MQADDPPFLTVGTDVSAKYKGAFCEAKIKKVVKNIKCRVTLKVGGAITVNDEAIVKGNLRIGNTVQVKQDPKKDSVEAVLNKIQDCSQYTVVFDDGDITTLRRSALCLKSGRHFNESETLDQLPLTHPEHFSTPVIAGRRGRRGRAQSEDSEGDAPVRPRKTDSTEQEPHVGRVVLVDNTSGTERRRPQPPAFPALVVAPTTQINVKDDYIVRSFKDGRYYTVPKKETREFRKGSAPSDWAGVDAALQYMNNGVLPPHWDRDTLFNEPRNTSDDVSSSSDDEPREEKDHFVAQLYKFMDDRGTPLNRNPTIANRDIDLYRLFRVVQKLGGYNRVTNQNQWKSIADKMGFHPVNTSITNLCKQAYKKFLHSFEDFYRKLGVTLVAHPRGARTPPAGRSLIRDRDKQLPSSTTPTPTTQRVKSDKDSDKSEADKSEKEDGKPEPKVEKEVKEKEKVKEKDKEKEKEKSRSDEDDSADNEPLSVVPKIEKEKEKEKEKDRERDRDKDKEKEKEKEKPTEEKEKIKTQKTRIPISSRMVKETQEKRTPKPRRSLSTREKGDSNGTSTSTSRVSSRPQVSTDSDSSGRASRNNFRCGLNKKMQSRRSQSANSASSGNTVASNSSKRARKRKTTEPSQEEHVLLRGPGNIKASVGDKLQVYYGPAQPESKVTYEAKVIEISAEGLLRVHYTGWNTRYDEWIKPQRIALNVTEHERSGKKVIIGGRRVRPKRAEGSPARSDSSDSDSEIERKRTPPSEPDDKNKPEPCTSKGRRLSSAPIRLKELKSEITPNKIRKRATRNSTSAALTPIPKRRRSSLTHSGRDYDLIEIRSELKGLHSVKQETDDNLKTEVIEKDVSITDLPEQKHDDKQAEDVYEFKEPEPFELELHDEKKKRTHRIFDDISPSKYTSTLTKSLSEEISEDLRTRPLRSPSLSPFRDYPLTGRHSPDDDLKDAVFSMDDDSFPGDGLSGPVFEGFTPAKHQETYSKKRKISKLIDDSPDSPADDEHSSDEEADDIKLKDAREKERSPVKAIKDVSKSPERSRKELHLEMYKEHNMETKEEENKELEEAPPPAVIVEKIEETKLVAIPSAIALPPIDSKIEDMDTSTDLNTPDSPQMDTEEDKSEPDSPARSDIIPDPPPGFLLHSEGPKIVDKLLQAIAKQQSKSPPPAEELPDTPEIDPSPEITKLEAKIPPKIEIVKELDTTSKSSIFDEPPILSDTMSDIRKVKSPSRLLSPLNVLERRKSLVDMPLCSGAKSNKVLSDTIQKLSSQINQPVSNITLPAFPPEDRSSSSDSDDSDRRLIIDKLSVDEWGSSGGSSEGPVAPARAVSGVHATKSPGEWSVGETLLMLEDACKNERKHSANVVVAGNMRSRTVSGVSAAEEDSNLSLLLCEETIPGSPAPDTEPTPQRLRPHMPFASAPSHHNTEERRTESSILGMGSGVSGLNSSDNGRRIPTRETSAWGRSIEQSPSTTPDSGSDMSPHRDNRRSRDSPPERKDDEEDSRPHEPIAMDLEKTIGGIRSRKASESSGAGMSVPVSAGRGRPRRCRRDTDEPPLMPPIPVPGPTLKYNFYVELDARWDSQSRINLITSKLSDLRKAYHDVKAELAAIDRRRKKLRRKEREAIKAAKAACS